MEARSTATVPVRTLEDVRRAFEEEMAREDRELLAPLLDRMTEISEHVAEGRPVDPDYIEVGLRLWSRFVDELHDRRMRRLLAMIPPNAEYAAPAPAPRARLRLPRLRPPTVTADPALTAELVGVRGEQARMSERMRELSTYLDRYRTGGFYARQLLGSLMRSGAFSDRAWVAYEEEFVLRRLKERLPPRADAGLGEDVAVAGRWRTSFETEVREFLARPVAFASPTAPGREPPSPPAPRPATPVRRASA